MNNEKSKTVENILYIKLPNSPSICMIETSIFSSKTHEYLSIYPPDFINVEVLDISFYKYDCGNIDFKYFLRNPRISLDMVSQNDKVFIYNLLSRYFK